MRNCRNNRGNMLVMSCMVMAFVALMMVLGSSFGGLAFVHNRLQSSADEIALAGARKLNDMDRIGQMNNMVARCRQLVYRQDNGREDAAVESDSVQHLADQLLTEASESAQALEYERSHVLLPLCQADANTAMQEKFNTIAGSYRIVLPWLKISALSMPARQLGEISDVECNVQEMTQLDTLAAQDRSDGCVRLSPALCLYKRDRDHRLHGTHSFLSFKLSSLPAPVDKVVSPARAALSNEFHTTPPGYIQSAAQVKLALVVETGLGATARSDMKALGTAAATGADIQM